MKIENKAFIFETALIEGVICRRKNRFIMEAEVEDGCIRFPARS
ncbi:hypothetical protein [Sporomusa sp.]|nr:hypothetical protein [Sporomusa sp.]HWR05699.1 hypothetical protein [Sporomusa sp.]